MSKNSNSVKVTYVSGGSSDENNVIGSLIQRRSIDSKSSKSGVPKNTSRDNKHGIIEEPPFDYESLEAVLEKSDVVASNIGAYEQNIVGFGFDVSLVEEVEDTKKHIDSVKKIKGLFVDPNRNFESYTSISKRMVRDRETFGTGYYEVVRNIKGEIAELYYIPSKKIRIMRDYFDEETGNLIKMGFAQLENGSPQIYYKNFGETRSLNWKTGEYSDEKINYNDDATELIPFKIANSYSDYYGVPRYIPAETAVVGNYYASRTNINRFQNNCVPDKLVVVSNGTVISGEQDIRKYFTENFKGADNSGKALLIEVEGYEKDGLGKSGLEKSVVEVIDLNNWKDADFKEYEEKNDSKIRRVFRLNKFITGESEDINRATAIVAKEIAEEQVFNPERIEIDEIINQTIVTDLYFKISNVKRSESDFGINREISVPIKFKYKKMELIDPEIQLKRADSIASTKSGSLNEIRKLQGLEPYEDELADLPLFIIEQQMIKEAIANINQTATKAVMSQIENVLTKNADGNAIKMLINSYKIKTGSNGN